jgi:hypothetical protein
MQNVNIRERQRATKTQPSDSRSAPGFAHLNFEPIDGDVLPLPTFGANGIAPHLQI